MAETVDSILQHAAQSTLIASAAAQRRNAVADNGPEPWRIGEFVDADLRPSALASLSLDEAMRAELVVLDASYQGVPRSAAWLHKAIGLLEQADIDGATETEQLDAELQVERELRTQRQALADQAHADYVALVRREQGRAREPNILERFGQRFQILDDQAAVPAVPLVLSELEPRTHPSPRVKAFYRWQDLQAEVAAGPETDRRMQRLADGREVLRETALLERIHWLGHQRGVRQSRLGLLQEQLARLDTSPDSLPTRVFQSDDGRQRVISEQAILQGAHAGVRDPEHPALAAPVPVRWH